MWKPVVAISFGSVLGALLRWVLGTKLFHLFLRSGCPAATGKVHDGDDRYRCACQRFAADDAGRIGFLEMAEILLRRYP